MRKATLAAADKHFGDGGQLYQPLQECMARAIARILEFQPDEVEVVEDGDAVAGAGIFKDQFAQNILQMGPEQVSWAAWEIKRWDALLPQNTQWVLIRGNHDNDRRSNMANVLAILVRLLGVKVRYVDRSYVGDFGGGHYFEAAHGFGHSSYYANSYEEIRDCWQKHITLSRAHNQNIERFLRAHTHWLNVGQTIGYDVAIDTVGGWHRQERLQLGDSIRVPGVLLYLWDGEKLQIEKVEANATLLLAASEDPCLHFKNMIAAAQALSEIHAWGIHQGLW